jgi:hypothetical protein
MKDVKELEAELAEHERKAELAKKSADAARKLLDLQKAMKEAEAEYDQVNSYNVSVTPKQIVASNNVTSEIKVNKQTGVATRGRKPGAMSELILKLLKDAISEANRFIRFSDISFLVPKLKASFPNKSDDELNKDFRDWLYKDRQSKNPDLLHIEEYKEGAKRSRYIYGLHSFADANGQPKKEYMARAKRNILGLEDL